MEQENLNRPTWQLENIAPDLSKLLRKTLREVKDPELGLDVIELGLIRDAEPNGDQINLKMILTTPFCPYGPAIIQEVTERAGSALNRPVIVELGMEAWGPSMMEDGLAAEWGLF